jgi:predicted nucleic acid-binding protein
VEFLLRTSRGDAFEAVLADPEADLHVPALCDVEVASALRRLWLTKALSDERRDEAVADYLDLMLTRHGHVDLLPRVLALGGNLSAYDAVYAALAEALLADMVTADDRLRRGVTAHTSVRLL